MNLAEREKNIAYKRINKCYDPPFLSRFVLETHKHLYAPDKICFRPEIIKEISDAILSVALQQQAILIIYEYSFYSVCALGARASLRLLYFGLLLY